MLDYLIVGFGLGGACLSHRLENLEKDFVVFGDAGPQASQVAGGLYNPVVLKRFSMAWNANRQLEVALPFYRSFEKKFNEKFTESIPIHRKFNSIEEQNNWFTASDNPKLAPFLSPRLIKKHPNIHADHGFGKVNKTGIVQTKLLLDAYSKYLIGKNKLIPAYFDHSNLKIKKDFVQYENLQAKRVVFCEGFGLKQNPHFNYLPLQGNKGEYLIIEAPELKLKAIVKASYFIIPLGKNRYKFGASYERNFKDQCPSKSAKKRLLKNLETLIDCDYQIVDQTAGIRPTVSDRRPLVGQHPEHPNLFVCNGFGSRGVLIAPSVSENLINYIENEEPLEQAIDIRRFHK